MLKGTMQYENVIPAPRKPAEYSWHIQSQDEDRRAGKLIKYSSGGDSWTQHVPELLQQVLAGHHVFVDGNQVLKCDLETCLAFDILIEREAKKVNTQDINSILETIQFKSNAEVL